MESSSYHCYKQSRTLWRTIGANHIDARRQWIDFVDVGTTGRCRWRHCSEGRKRHDGWQPPSRSARRDVDPVPARPVATPPRTCCEWKFDRLVVEVSAVRAGKQSVGRRAYDSQYGGCRATCGWRPTTTTWRLGRKTRRRAARRRRPVRPVTDAANGVVFRDGYDLSLVLSTTSHHDL